MNVSRKIVSLKKRDIRELILLPESGKYENYRGRSIILKDDTNIHSQLVSSVHLHNLHLIKQTHMGGPEENPVIVVDTRS
jgi:hypothetical protein